MLHISLGPTCLPAYILKMCRLRTASYPLDWSRSGSTHLYDLCKLEPEAFYWSHVHNPSLQFVQKNNPEKTSNNTEELISRPNTYGYNYLYNPHRKLGGSKDYFIRTLNRFNVAIDGIEPISFFVADYKNKEGSSFFLNPIAQIKYIKETLLSRCQPIFSITMLRIELCNDNRVMANYHIQKHCNRSCISNVFIPIALDKTYATEQDLISKLLGKIYLESCMKIMEIA